MIAFQVSLNGKKLCMSLAIGGLTGDQHFEWDVPRELQVGDEVLIKIVATEAPDPPSRTKRDDKSFAEAEERKYYDHLKAKHESN